MTAISMWYAPKLVGAWLKLIGMKLLLLSYMNCEGKSSVNWVLFSVGWILKVIVKMCFVISNRKNKRLHINGLIQKRCIYISFALSVQYHCYIDYWATHASPLQVSDGLPLVNIYRRNSCVVMDCTILALKQCMYSTPPLEVVVPPVYHALGSWQHILSVEFG